MPELIVRNGQRSRPVRSSSVGALARAALEEELGVSDYAIGIYIVSDRRMIRLNEQHLGHEGSTDVITFPYSAPKERPLHGEIFVCMDEAIRQARTFNTGWDHEIARYVIHGLLHLQGYDDTEPKKRRVMKLQENRLFRRLAPRFPLIAPESARRVGP